MTRSLTVAAPKVLPIPKETMRAGIGVVGTASFGEQVDKTGAFLSTAWKAIPRETGILPVAVRSMPGRLAHMNRESSGTLVSGRAESPIAGLRPLLIATVLVLVSCSQPAQLTEIRGQTMGTTYSVKVVGEVRNPEGLKRAIDSLLEEINRQMSTYRDDSEITLFNESRSPSPFLVSSEFATVVERSLVWSQRTQGAFDVTIFPLLRLWGFAPGQPFPPRLEELPEQETVRKTLLSVGFEKLSVRDGHLSKNVPDLQIDLGAIAKGYGVDAVAEFLEGQGFQRFLVEIGGEVRCMGKNPQDVDWRVGIRKPLPGSSLEEPEWILLLHDSAVATSGDYESFVEREGVLYSHEIDPRTGWPARGGVASATVSGPTCLDADALATALMILSPDKGLRLVESLEDFEAFLVTRTSSGSFSLRKSSGMELVERSLTNQ